MAKNPGKIVEWTKNDGKIQKGFMLDSEQHENFSKFNKAFIRLVDEDLNFVIEEGTGKKLITVKQISNLRHIGFID